MNAVSQIWQLFIFLIHCSLIPIALLGILWNFKPVSPSPCTERSSIETACIESSGVVADDAPAPPARLETISSE